MAKDVELFPCAYFVICIIFFFNWIVFLQLYFESYLYFLAL